VTEKLDVAIIGGGQAGLAVSWYLTHAGVDNVVLEAGRLGETWRSRRWDSFCFVTPNWSMKLPGCAYDGPDPDGFMPLADILAHIEAWAKSFRAPVCEQTEVESVESDGAGGFNLATRDGEINARTVVVATGAYQKAHCPRGAEMIPSSVHSLFAEEYRNPGALPPGGVLIVGSAQTGCQLAEEIHEAGRHVYLACGRSPWTPRRIAGRDFVWWAAVSGFLDRSVDVLPSPAARLIGNAVATGHRGGHDLHIRTLDDMGVELLGRFIGAGGAKIYFADDLHASADFGDARLRDMWKYIEKYCAAAGQTPPAFDWPPPLRAPARTELDLERDDVKTIIWTSGYRPDYGWVNFPVVDDMGFPIQTDGVTSVPGLYFCGVHWMRKMKSSILYGVGEDAELVSQHIVENQA
jgi:putative flavoprotein involved in K+ transport